MKIIAISMINNNSLNNKAVNNQIPPHPLAKLAGKFKGQFWERTLENIEEFRKKEKQEINEYLDNENQSSNLERR
ncbi:MAG: hypothetical protein AAFY21_00985 [Cyanobacteria bacterium J06641_2]